jgi:YaiO family outer membrane protein
VKNKLVLAGILILIFWLSPVRSEVFLNRIEASYMYEYLRPFNDYGDWHSFNITYYRQQRPDFNYHLGATLHHRPITSLRESGILLFGGISKDWSARLYSNFSLSFGSKTDYLPEYRYDLDINLKLLKHRNLVFTLGYAYINYFTVHEDVLWRYGFTLYHKSLIFSIMFFDNYSDPGNVDSQKTQFSFGVGREHWQWTYLILDYGTQAYLNIYNPNQVKIEQDVIEIALKHRRWLKRDFGFFLTLSLLELEASYTKYGVQFGLFWQY